MRKKTKAPRPIRLRGWADPLNPPLSREQRDKCEQLSHKLNPLAKYIVKQKISNELDEYPKQQREAHRYFGITPTLWEQLCSPETEYHKRWRQELIDFSRRESLRKDVRAIEAALKWERIPQTLRASASLVLSRLHDILSTPSRMRRRPPPMSAREYLSGLFLEPLGSPPSPFWHKSAGKSFLPPDSTF